MNHVKEIEKKIRAITGARNSAHRQIRALIAEKNVSTTDLLSFCQQSRYEDSGIIAQALELYDSVTGEVGYIRPDDARIESLSDLEQMVLSTPLPLKKKRTWLGGVYTFSLLVGLGLSAIVGMNIAHKGNSTKIQTSVPAGDSQHSMVIPEPVKPLYDVPIQTSVSTDETQHIVPKPCTGTAIFPNIPKGTRIRAMDVVPKYSPKLKLSPGKHRFWFDHPDYEPKFIRVDVKCGVNLYRDERMTKKEQPQAHKKPLTFIPYSEEIIEQGIWRAITQPTMSKYDKKFEIDLDNIEPKEVLVLRESDYGDYYHALYEFRNNSWELLLNIGRAWRVEFKNKGKHNSVFVYTPNKEDNFIERIEWLRRGDKYNLVHLTKEPIDDSPASQDSSVRVARDLNSLDIKKGYNGSIAPVGRSKMQLDGAGSLETVCTFYAEGRDDTVFVLQERDGLYYEILGTNPTVHINEVFYTDDSITHGFRDIRAGIVYDEKRLGNKGVRNYTFNGVKYIRDTGKVPRLVKK